MEEVRAIRILGFRTFSPLKLVFISNKQMPLDHTETIMCKFLKLTDSPECILFGITSLEFVFPSFGFFTYSSLINARMSERTQSSGDIFRELMRISVDQHLPSVVYCWNKGLLYGKRFFYMSTQTRCTPKKIYSKVLDEKHWQGIRLKKL